MIPIKKFTRREFLSLAVASSVIGVLTIKGAVNLKNKDFQGQEPSIIDTKEQCSFIQLDKLKMHINALTDKTLAGRRAGTSGEAKACLYLANQLQNMGLEPAGDQGTFFQSFPIPEMMLRMDGKRAVFSRVNNSSQLVGENVLGIIRSKKNANQYLVLSAHLDHLGIWNDNLYLGANDNASGVAGVLEITKLLNEKKDELPCSILIAFWSAEEMGLIGSRYFMHHSTVPIVKIKLNINLDSRGSGKKNDFIFWSRNMDNMSEWLANSGLDYSDYKMAEQVNNKHSSDHRSFLECDIPALTFLSANWLDKNHSPGDVPDNINYEKIADLGHLVVEMILSPKIEELMKA